MQNVHGYLLLFCNMSGPGCALWWFVKCLHTCCYMTLFHSHKCLKCTIVCFNNKHIFFKLTPWSACPPCLSLQVMTSGLYHYYVTELAFYWSLMFSQFTDIKRKVRGTTQTLCLLGQTTLDTPQLPLPVKHLLISLLFLILQLRKVFPVYVHKSFCIKGKPDMYVLQALTVMLISEGHMFLFVREGARRSSCCSVCECLVFSARGQTPSCDCRTEQA